MSLYVLIAVCCTILIAALSKGMRRELQLRGNSKELKPSKALLTLGLVLISLGLYMPFHEPANGTTFQDEWIAGVSLMVMTSLPGTYFLLYYFKRRIVYNSDEITSFYIVAKPKVIKRVDIIKIDSRPIKSKHTLTLKDNSTIDINHVLEGSANLIEDLSQNLT